VYGQPASIRLGYRLVGMERGSTSDSNRKSKTGACHWLKCTHGRCQSGVPSGLPTQTARVEGRQGGACMHTQHRPTLAAIDWGGAKCSPWERIIVDYSMLRLWTLAYAGRGVCYESFPDSRREEWFCQGRMGRHGVVGNANPF
jgi:hypothetical protein